MQVFTKNGHGIGIFEKKSRDYGISSKNLRDGGIPDYRTPPPTKAAVTNKLCSRQPTDSPFILKIRPFSVGKSVNLSDF